MAFVLSPLKYWICTGDNIGRMKGYGQFCPVAKAAEILAERWTLLVVRELLVGSTHFNDIRKGVPLMSPSLLSQRLKELTEAGIVERRTSDNGPSSEYIPTEAGRELWPVVELMGRWGQRWGLGRLDPDDFDPRLLMWDIRRRIDVAPFRRRSVIRFDLSGARKGRGLWWIVVDRGEVDLCLKAPDDLIDVVVRSDVQSLAEVWIGSRNLRDSLGDGTLSLEGDWHLCREFPRWFTLSILARQDEETTPPVARQSPEVARPA
jgi:DNA-binding HxlR family transcriptional regulator